MVNELDVLYSRRELYRYDIIKVTLLGAFKFVCFQDIIIVSIYAASVRNIY